MPKATKASPRRASASRPRATTRRRKSKSLLSQLGAINLFRPLKLSRSQALLAAGFMAVIGIAAVAYSFAASSYSFWSNSATPSKTAADTQATELGLKFHADSDGTIDAVRFYKAKTNTGVHTGTLWTSSGQRLATLTFTSETGSGWQTAKFASPVKVTANTTYVVSYHTNVGHYALNNNYFTKGRDKGPLHAPGSTTTSPNGVYAHGVSAFPTQPGQATNYWVDVVFSPAAISTPTPTATVTPTPTSTPITGGKPDATNTGVPAGTTLTVVDGNQTFDSTYDGQTISNKDFRGFIKVTGSNITFKNCIFHGGKATGNTALLDTQVEDSTSPYTHRGGKNLVVEDSEFVPINPSVLIDGIWGENLTILRVNVHGSVDGMKLSNNSIVRDSYIHDMQWYAVDPNTSDGTHNDCVQILDGTNIQVIHDNLNPNSSYANSSVQITQDFGTTGTVLLDSNWADWGGYSFNISQKRNSDLTGTLNTVSVTNNRFGRHGEYGAVKIGTGVTLAAFSGNVWDDTGLPIPQPDKNNN
ncbi:MAG TPA: DUF4082 domain-containing protein [Candidatus Saccharimonadia bacterium]|nr:DUF4082 domain-containing protein [Candidatus Saccharimonadia bacterium]